MNNMGRDIRYALRQLLKSPGFTATAVLTLAFGIGATTAIFSIVEGVLLRPPPFADPKSLVILGDTLDSLGMTSPSVPAPEAAQYTRDTHSFSSMGAYEQTGYELSGIGDPAQINASRLNAGVFTALGVSPLMGRVFTQPEDDGKAQLAVLSYQTWRSRFQGNPQVIGAKLLLDRKPYEVIGVMPRDFEFPLVPGQLNRSELWVPISFSQGELVQGAASWNFQMVGRLKPGVTAARAEQEMQPITRAIMQAFPAAMSGVRIAPAVQRLDESTVAQARPLVRTLFLAVTVVLFIACANLAGLLLVRVIRRRREIATRLALGSQRSTVVGLILASGAKLGLAGCVIGGITAIFDTRLLHSLLFQVDPLDPFVLVLSALAIFALALTSSIIPARRAASVEPMQALRMD